MTMPLLAFNQVGLHFPRLEKPILSDISYTVQAGDFVVILGSNGSGKSSFLKLIDRHYTLTSGQLLLEGKPIHSIPDVRFRDVVKTLTQNCHDSLFISLTVLENYALVKQQHEGGGLGISLKKEREFFADYVNAFNPNLSLKLDQVVEQLSGGEKQALALALAMLYPPRILLLDEHTSALDPKSAEIILDVTRKMAEKYKITCLLTTHDLKEAKAVGNRILALKNGRIHRMIESAEKMNVTAAELLESCY